MPRIVDLGPGYGVASWPDEATDEQIVADYQNLENTRQQKLKEAKLLNVRLADIVEEQKPTLGKTALRAALGVEAGLAAAPVTLGTILQKAATSPWIRGATPEQAKAIVEGQPMPERPVEELQPGAFGAPAGFGLNFPTATTVGKALVSLGKKKQEAARAEGEQIGGGVPGAIAGSLAETAAVSGQTLPFALAGMGPVSVAAGLQGYSLTREQFKDQLLQRNPKLTEEEAYRQAEGPAALSGAVTGILTRGFGGVERFVERIATEGLKKEGVKSLLREGFKSATMEFPEEWGDELAQGFIEKARINPEKPISEIFNQANLAGLAGFALGGLTTGGIALPVKTGEAVAGRIERGIEAGRLRRTSARASEERIKRAITERETQDAQGLGTTTGQAAPIGEQAQVEQRAEEPIQVRRPTEVGMGTSAGAITGEIVPESSPGASDLIRNALQSPAGLSKLISSGGIPTTLSRNQFSVIRKGLENTIDTPPGNAKDAGYFVDAVSIAPQVFNFLPVSLKRMVQSTVLGMAANNPQVARAIVPFVPIDVVNNLSGNQFTSQSLLDNPAMLLDVLSSNPNSPVWSGVVNGLVKSKAIPRTEWVSNILESARRPSDRLSALATFGLRAVQPMVIQPVSQAQTREEVTPSERKEERQQGRQEVLATAPVAAAQPAAAAVQTPAPTVSTSQETAVRPTAQFGGYQFDNPNMPSFMIPGVRPGIMRNVNADMARAAGYEIPAQIPTFDEWVAGGRQIPKPTVSREAPTLSRSQQREWRAWREEQALPIESRLGLPSSEATANAMTPVNWQAFSMVDQNGEITANPAAIYQEVMAGNLDGGAAGNAMLLHLLRPSTLHPLNKIVLNAVDTPDRTEYFGQFSIYSDERGGTIEILLKHPDGSLITKAEFVKVLNHELLHNNVERQYAQADATTRQDTDDLYAFVKKESAGTDWEFHNATSSVAEFLVEALSNPRFQEFLLGLDYSSKIRQAVIGGRISPAIRNKSFLRSAFGGFLDIVKRLFKVPDVVIGPNGERVDAITALDQAVNLSTALEVIQRQSQDEREGRGALITAAERAGPNIPQFFRSRQQVEAAIANPLLEQTQIAEARDLAAVQSSMSPDNLVGWIMGQSANKAEDFAKQKLAYIEERRYLSQTPKTLASLPTGTTDEQHAAELAGATVLGHYGVDRAVQRKIDEELEADKQAMAKATTKLAKQNNAQLKANFLTGLFNRLTRDYRVYLNNLIAAAPASENLQAQWRQRLSDAERRLNEQAASPTAVKNALSAIAGMIPSNLLATGTTNQQIIDWINQQGVLNNVVGQEVKDWLLVDDGTGSPALLGYTSFVKDLNSLKDVLNNQQTLDKDIQAFEQWFNPTGTTGKISPKRFAENYFKFRTGRDRALNIARTIEDEIDHLDTRIHGNMIAGDKLTQMMSSQDYVAAVRLAAERADVVVRALYDTQGLRTGLIERDRTVGLWRMQGPMSGTEYVVDLYPSSGQEADNRSNLAAFISEARTYASQHAQDDPLLADEYNKLAQYIEEFLIHPSMDPIQGFTQTPWMRIPFTNIKVNPDPFDSIFTAASGAAGYSFQTIKDVLDRLGGRAARQSVLDAYELDTVMRKVEAVNANPDYGYAAQTQAILKAIESHGWTSEMFPMWDENVAEKVLAAGQNNLGPNYEIGDKIIGSSVVLTAEDVAALKIMKKWEDGILQAAPRYIQDRVGDLGVVRKAVGTGRYIMSRIAAPWTRTFVIEWGRATTPQQQLALLNNDTLFRRIVLGYIGEFNPEFHRMNPASPTVSPLFNTYRYLAKAEKTGVQTFNDLNQVLDGLAAIMVQNNLSPTITEARKTAQETLLKEIGQFIKAFETNVLEYENNDIWGGVPKPVIKSATANNAFTTPRGSLQAPSTFYSYSVASDGRRWMHVGGLRSLLNLKLLQSGYEARVALEGKKAEFERRLNDLKATGMNAAEAMAQVQKESEAARKASEIRYDYKEILVALRAIEQAFGNLERYESSTADHYQHAGVAALNNVFGTIKAFLLSSAQAITTNFWSGTLLGPAIIHWQTGQYLKAIKDVVPATHLWKTLMKRVASVVEGNPTMSKLLKQHGPFWNWMAKGITEAAVDWRRIQQIAESTGMVAPYNLGKVLDNKAALKPSAGRLETDDPHGLVQWTNSLASLFGVRHISEAVKAATPRFFDNLINYSLIAAYEQDLEFLKKAGWTAFQAREAAAAPTGANWKDLSDPDNILLPGDLGLRTFKGLQRYRQLFAPLGSLDGVLLDYYERTKNMTQDQREAEPLITDPDDYAGLALQYASVTNVAVETNRPYSLKGKGSDGVWRNIVGTFMGWSVNMTKNLSRELQTHSKDPKFNAIANNMLGIATVILLLAAVGAWNWEFGDELTKKLYQVSSARIQPGNVTRALQQGDYRTAATYFVQALVNTVPVFGSTLGGLAGVAFTGRGQPFDLTSISPQLGFVSDVWNTAKRVVQTGDVSLPLADFTRRWMPFSKIAINRLPLMRGLVEQQNAIRSLNGAAPPGTEIKWGQRGAVAKYGPANDEIQKLIASAYEAASHGGSLNEVQQRLDQAVAAYVKTGMDDAAALKAVGNALAGKEPIRVLTGKEFTPEEEQKWISRMTPDQKADYAKAVAAWQILSDTTGKDLNMVSSGPAGGPTVGGAGMASPYLATMRRYVAASRQAVRPTIGYLRGIRPARALTPVRARGPSRPRLRRPRGQRIRSALRSPQVARPRTRLSRLRRLNRRIRRRSRMRV